MRSIRLNAAQIITTLFMALAISASFPFLAYAVDNNEQTAGNETDQPLNIESPSDSDAEIQDIENDPIDATPVIDEIDADNAEQLDYPEAVESVEPLCSDECEQPESSSTVKADAIAPDRNASAEAKQTQNVYLKPESTKPTTKQKDGATVIEDGVYTIASAISKTAHLEIGGASNSNGAQAQVYSNNCSAAQRWSISSLGNGLYKIINAASGKSLDVAGAKIGNGARVQQYSWNGTDAQKWRIETTSTGYAIYSALSSTYLLDLAGANTQNCTVVQLYKSNETKAQRWNLALIKPELSQGTYMLASKASGKKLDVAGGSIDNCANAQQYQSNSTISQVFSFQYSSSDGYYTILASASGLALDVAGASNSNGANVQLYKPNGTLAQKWAALKNSDGTYSFRSALNGKALDVSGASKANGANVQMWAWNATNAQRWSLTSAGNWSLPDGVYNIVTSINTANSLGIAHASRSQGGNATTVSNSNTSWVQKWLVAKDSKGYCTFRNLNSRMYLSAASKSAKSGTNVIQVASCESDAQLWKLELTKGGILVRSKLNNSLVLDISGANTSAGANVQVYSNNGTYAQKYRVRSTDLLDNNRSFVFINETSGKALDVSNGSHANGAVVQLYEVNGTGSQCFKAVAAGNGKYYLQNIQSGKYIDVDTNTTTKIQQWEGKSGANKQWSIRFDAASCSFTINSPYVGKTLDGSSGKLSLKSPNSTDAQRFILQPITFKLFLDAGHIVGKEGYDSGAVGNGYTEAQLTSDLTDRVYKICVEQYGLDVVDGKSYGLSYEKRTGKAVELGCTSFVSIHFNAGGGTGFMSIVGGPDRRNSNSPLLTSIMHSHLSSAMSGLQNNGISTRGDLAVVNNGRIPATLLEIAFIDNGYDMQVYDSRRDAVARSLAQGILEASLRSELC